MKLTWTTTASIILEYQGTVIAFDPFCGISQEGPKTDRARDLLTLYRKSKYIFVTHGHFDHILHIPRICRKCPVSVYATKTPAATLIRRGISPDKVTIIAPGHTQQIGPFKITAFASRHCIFDLRLIVQTAARCIATKQVRALLKRLRLHQTFPENGETLMYEVSCEGKRIQILGSLNLQKNVSCTTGADLLILPLQGKSSLTPYALSLTAKLLPKEILIDHHDDSFPPLSASIDPHPFAKEAERIYGITCRIPSPGELYECTL